MRKWITLIEHAASPHLFVEDGTVVMELNGRRIGWFTLDREHAADGRVSVHSSIDREYQKRGYGKIAYDWIAKWLSQQGLRLSPGNRLSDSAYRLWLKRDPSAVADYEMRDYFVDQNGKRHTGLEPQWYSRHGLEKWNLTESVAPVTHVLPAGTILFHDRSIDEPWDIADLMFPAWFSFDGHPWANLIHGGKTELVAFEVTREVVLMDGADDEIQDMYDNGAHTDDIACIPEERGFAGWMIPGSEVLLNDPTLVKYIGPVGPKNRLTVQIGCGINRSL